MQIALWPQAENTGSHCHCQVCFHHFWTERLNIGSSLTKLRSCTITRSFCTLSRHLSFLLQLVLEVFRHKKGTYHSPRLSTIFFHRKGLTAQYSQRTSLTYNGTTELPSRTGLREQKKMMTSCIIFCFRAANQQNQEVTAHNHIHTVHLRQSQGASGSNFLCSH